MSDKEMDAFGSSDIPPEVADHAKIDRLTRERDELREALDRIFRLERVERVNGSTSWIATCNEMRTIASVALATKKETM